MPSISPEEIQRFRQIFDSQSPQNGLLSADTMYSLLSKSELDHSTLQKVWQLADIDQDGSVDFDEFTVAMRLTFDLKYGKIDSLPSSLPDWLIPASKRHLLVASGALSGTLGSSNIQTGAHYDDDEDLRLRSDFNWYISPNDRATYEKMYSANADPRGKISYSSFDELYGTLNVPPTDISSAWNLVNPRSDEKIDKEQVLVFLHMLNQRSNGVRIPRSVPASLRATFSKQTPGFDLNSKQATIQQPLKPEKKTFGEAYMDRLGLGSHQYSSSGTSTDFSATKDKEWEEVRLQRELKELEKLIERIQEEKKQTKDSSSSIIRRELQLLLEYKQKQLKAPAGGSGDLSGLTTEVEMIDEQVAALKDHLKSRERQLSALREQIASI